MTTLTDIDGLTDGQLIVRVATEVMGWCRKDRGNWKKYGRGVLEAWWLDEKAGKRTGLTGWQHAIAEWNPLTDWNHLREIENKVLSNPTTAEAYVVELKTCTILSGHVYDHELDARARCLSALKALSPSSNA